MSVVRPLCICSPLRVQLIPRSLGLENSSSVTNHGPEGLNPGKDCSAQIGGLCL